MRSFATFIQQSLENFYNFKLPVTLEPFIRVGADYKKAGECLFLELADDELEIAILIHKNIESELIECDPQRKLKSQNLNAACVLIEEISHAFMFIKRALEGRKVSLLELETQSEIDKLLMCAHLLFTQTGDTHARALYLALYDHFSISASTKNEIKRYELATQIARNVFKETQIALQENVDPFKHFWLRRQLNELSSLSIDQKMNWRQSA